MASECLAVIHVCKVRITRLSQLGVPTAGPNNVYVSDKPMQVQVTPVIEAGVDRTLVGGCDCIIATYRGADKLKRFDLELDLGVVDPALMEMMLGSTAVTQTGNIVGQWWSANAFVCGSAVQPNVCFEAWQDTWNDDEQDPNLPYVHWIWPSSFWQIAPYTLQNDFAQPKLTGYTRGNSVWGLGIFGDVPQAVGSLGGFIYTATPPPAAACGYQSYAIT